MAWITLGLESARQGYAWVSPPRPDSPGLPNVAHGTGYLVMSYLEGLTLKDYLARQGGRIPFKPALAILMPVMDALRAVHQVGLLHRDISPDNIFLTRDRQVKLIDFGAARAALGAHSRSLSVILKPGYAPPEQYGSQGRQGPWTDVYAVGATLYQMLTGEMPPEAPDRLYQDTIKSPAAYGADLPQAVELALFKALAVRVEQRFQAVAELQAALVQAAEGQPVAPPVTPSAPTPPKAPEPAKPPSGCFKILVMVILWIIFLVFSIAWWISTQTPPPTTLQYTPTQTSTPVAQPQPRKPRYQDNGDGTVTNPYEQIWKSRQKPRYQDNGDGTVTNPYEQIWKSRQKPRYQDNGDGTVTDGQTGRQWMRCALGQRWQGGTCIGEAKEHTWQAALDAASTLNRQGGYAGYRDWRVPTIKELRTLVYCSSGQPKTWNDTEKPCGGDYERPTLYQPAFPNTPPYWCWSSSVDVYPPGLAWYVNFYGGDVSGSDKNYAVYVRLVRGGQ